MLNPIRQSKPKTLEERLDAVESKVMANSETLKENQTDIKEIRRLVEGTGEASGEALMANREVLRIGDIAAKDRFTIANILEEAASQIRKSGQQILEG
jgi:hypothetical protein